MLYSEIIAVCSEIHTKHINTLCGNKVEILNVKTGGIYSKHQTLEHRYQNNWMSVVLQLCYMFSDALNVSSATDKDMCVQHALVCSRSVAT
jgi:hypothetical protein